MDSKQTGWETSSGREDVVFCGICIKYYGRTETGMRQSFKKQIKTVNSIEQLDVDFQNISACYVDEQPCRHSVIL